MRTIIEKARIDLARWEANVAADQAALLDYQQAAATVRARLEVAERTAASLRTAVERWDAMHARHKPPNVANQPDLLRRPVIGGLGVWFVDMENDQ